MYKGHMGSRSESKLLLGLGHSERVEAGKTGMVPLVPSSGVTPLQLEVTSGVWGTLELSSQELSPIWGRGHSAHLIEPLDLLFLVLSLPREWAQLVLQVLDLLAQFLGLCCQLFLVSLQGVQGW